MNLKSIALAWSCAICLAQTSHSFTTPSNFITVSDGDDLFAIAEAAPHNSALEIRSNATFIGTLRWRNKFLSIKAAEGFSPTILGSGLNAAIELNHNQSGGGGEFTGLTLGSQIVREGQYTAGFSGPGEYRFKDNAFLGEVVSGGGGSGSRSLLFQDNQFFGRFQIGGTGDLVQKADFYGNAFGGLVVVSGTGDSKANVRLEGNKLSAGFVMGGTGDFDPDLVAVNNLFNYTPANPFGYAISLTGIAGSFPTARFVNNTVVGHPSGLIVSENARATFENMLLNNVRDVDFRTSMASIANSLIADGTFNQVNGNFAAAPMLDSQFQPLPGSPAIDAGNNSASQSTAYDYWGRPRIFDGNFDGVARVDVGAFEFVPEPSVLVLAFTAILGCATAKRSAGSER